MNGYWMCYINDGNKVKCYEYHRITKKWNKCFKNCIVCAAEETELPEPSNF